MFHTLPAEIEYMIFFLHLSEDDRRCCKLLNKYYLQYLSPECTQDEMDDGLPIDTQLMIPQIPNQRATFKKYYDKGRRCYHCLRSVSDSSVYRTCECPEMHKYCRFLAKIFKLHLLQR